MIIHDHISDTIGYLGLVSTHIISTLDDFNQITENKSNVAEIMNYELQEYDKIIEKHKSSITPIYEELKLLKMEFLRLFKGPDFFEKTGWLHMNIIIGNMQKSIFIHFKNDATFKKNVKENFPHINLD